MTIVMVISIRRTMCPGIGISNVVTMFARKPVWAVLITVIAMFAAVLGGSLPAAFLMSPENPFRQFAGVVGTALAFGAMLAVHSLRIIRVTPKFTRFVIAAGIALMGLMVVNWLASFFIEDGIGIRSGGPLSFIFSIAAILVGCFFLLLDFNDIEQGVAAGIPDRYAWLMAFGLTVTLVWIYLEVLRFLSYFSNSD